MLRDGSRGGKEVEDRLSVSLRGAGTREEDRGRVSIEPSADGISGS